MLMPVNHQVDHYLAVVSNLRYVWSAAIHELFAAATSDPCHGKGDGTWCDPCTDPDNLGCDGECKGRICYANQPIELGSGLAEI